MSETLLAAALSYAAMGWLVAPLHSPAAGACSCGRSRCPSPAKHPRTWNGLKDASSDPKIINRWWQVQWADANVAVVTGRQSGIVVLDIDPGHGGEESLEELQRAYGRLPGTVEAITGSGGRHLFFRHPGAEMRIRNKQTWAEYPGVDVRGDGGYVVAAPSLHMTGRHYEWELSSVPGEVPLAELPDWLLALLTGGSPDGHGEKTGRYEKRGDEGAPADLAPILAGCAWLRHCRDDAATLGEGPWYAMLSVVGRCENGRTTAHEWSKPYPTYDPDETDKKLRHALQDTGPASCRAVKSGWGGEAFCRTCVHLEKIKSPIVLGRHLFPEAPPESWVTTAQDYDDFVPVDPDAEPLTTATQPGSPAPATGTSNGKAPEKDDGAPQAVRAEKALLAAALTGMDVIRLRAILETIDPPDFYVPAHDRIWGAIRDLTERLQPVDLLTVTDCLQVTGELPKVGGEPFLRALAAENGGHRELEAYAALIRRASRLRCLESLFQAAARDCRAAGAEPDEITQEVAHTLLLGEPHVNQAVEYGTALFAEVARIERAEEEKALEMGIQRVDDLTGGLGRGEVGLICARPGLGKSILCAMQLHHAARTWGPILHISLEMEAAEIVRRDLARLTGIGFKELRRARDLTNADLGSVREARDELDRLAHRIWIDQWASTLTRLISRVHRYRLQYDIQAVIVDYGQLVTDDTTGRPSSKAEEVMHVARALKNEIAMPTNIPVWVAVQANRKSEEGGGAAKPLTFSDLGWSSEWEAVAGRILFINRDGPPPKEDAEEAEKRIPVMLHVAKNRHGGRGRIRLVLDGPRFQFVEAADNRYEGTEPTQAPHWGN